MREIVYLLVLSAALSSCYGKTNPDTTDKRGVAKTIDYTDTFYRSAQKKEKDSHYFYTWTPVDKKNNRSSQPPLNTILNMIKAEYNETDIIAKIQNTQFKIIPYRKDADEKAIEYTAMVTKCYKGHCPKKIHYRISYEIGDTIHPKNTLPAIVLLSTYEDAYYLNDPFVYFPVNKKLDAALEAFIEQTAK